MTKISANVRLRPTRIGFLTSPNDLESIRKIMRVNTCLWGGRLNPIIPVMDTIPKLWKEDISPKLKPLDVTKGYIRFFEPDVYVEATKGLAEKLGLSSQLEPTDSVVTLDEFLSPEPNKPWAEIKFGSNMHEVLEHIYKTKQQFVLREPQESFLISPNPNNCGIEAMFGVYPTDIESSYFVDAYRDVYKPTIAELTPEIWRRALLQNGVTPLYATSDGLTFERSWKHDLILFVFDSTNSLDLIDLWNLKLEPSPVLPIPVELINEIIDDVKMVLKDEFRSLPGNPNGVMHHSTIQFGRSISKQKARTLTESLIHDVPSGAMMFKYWKNPIWNENPSETPRQFERLSVYAKEHGVEIQFEPTKRNVSTFTTLTPDFSSDQSLSHHGWVNVLKFDRLPTLDFATTLPFNALNRNWPRTLIGSDEVLIGKEGWVFQQNFSRSSEFIHMLSPQQAIVGSLRALGVDAVMSEPGNIAWQMLEQLEGPLGAHIIADIDTLKLLNNMAVSLKRKSNAQDAVEESFSQRTASIKSWHDLLARRKQRQSHNHAEISQYTSSNIIRLGLETDCPHCLFVNWHTLTNIDYSIICERCLKKYDFPQASLRDRNRNFTYRVIGPFSVPDYGRGSYSAILTLRLLALLGDYSRNITFSTAMNLAFDKEKCEVDLIAWYSSRTYGFEHAVAPRLVIGECKSLGHGELITANDLTKLKLAATKLPNVIIIISVLRDHFTQKELKLLKSFAKWGRRRDSFNEPTNPVLLLTSTELIADFTLQSQWKKLGGRHAEFSKKASFRNLINLCDITQQLHLDLPSFDDEKYQILQSAKAKIESNKAKLESKK